MKKTNIIISIIVLFILSISFFLIHHKYQETDNSREIVEDSDQEKNMKDKYIKLITRRL